MNHAGFGGKGNGAAAAGYTAPAGNVIVDGPAAAGPDVAPRAAAAALEAAALSLRSKVGALCHTLDALIETESATEWVLGDRFTGAVKARVVARAVRVAGTWTVNLEVHRG